MACIVAHRRDLCNNVFVTATEQLTGPAPAEGAKYGAGAAGQGAHGTGCPAGACPEDAAAVEPFATATARAATGGPLTGCEAVIAAADRAFTGGIA